MDVEHTADPEHRHAGKIESADVIKRTGHQQTRVGGEPERDDVIHALPIEVIVGVHHAFRPIGRARGVHQAKQFIRPAQMHGRGRGIGRKDRRVDLRRLVEQDRGGYILDCCGKFHISKQKLRIRVADDVLDFVGGEAKIDRQEHGTEMARGERELEKGGRILHHHRDDIVRPDAARGQIACRFFDTLVEFGETDAAVLVNDRQPFRRARRVIADEARQIDHRESSQWRRTSPLCPRIAVRRTASLARLCRGHPRLPCPENEDVDGRNKSGHDGRYYL